MSTTNQVTKKSLWAGWIITALVALFLVFDGVTKVIKVPAVTNLRAGSPLFSESLFPVYFGVLVWAGIYFRDVRLRALIPLRSSSVENT